MRALSHWAKIHPHLARTVIVLLHGVLGLLAWYIGITLLDLDVHLPMSLSYMFGFLFVIIAFIYSPKRITKYQFSKKGFYYYRKTCDFIIGTCSFAIMICFFNNFSLSPAAATANAAVNTTALAKKATAAEILTSLQYRDKSTLTRSEKRVLKKEFRHQLKVYVKAKATGHKDEVEKALLIILTIFIAIGLLAVIAALACTLACNGAEALAWLLIIVGTVGVIWGTVAVIRSINKGPKPKMPPVSQ